MIHHLTHGLIKYCNNILIKMTQNEKIYDTKKIIFILKNDTIYKKPMTQIKY